LYYFVDPLHLACILTFIVFSYAERMRTASPEEWAAILARAKEKKGQEGAVDSSVALKVRDLNPPKGTKRKRRTPAADLVKKGKTGPERASMEEVES
jgi:hypothetical protein